MFCFIFIKFSVIIRSESIILGGHATARLTENDMRYHINTGLIHEKFEESDFCPLCEIEKIVENGICRELLGDGCMDDDVRKSVNEKGFCGRHFDLLYSMPSKLGLALQTKTRITKVAEKLTVPTSAFAARKAAKILLAENDKCIVCDLTADEMIKYYKTIAQMFANEKPFAETLKKANGFCNKHFAHLLEYSSCAGSETKAYLKAITDVQQKLFGYDLDLLQTFAARHDYRNIGKPLGEAENALPRIRRDLYGKK